MVVVGGSFKHHLLPCARSSNSKQKKKSGVGGARKGTGVEKKERTVCLSKT